VVPLGWSSIVGTGHDDSELDVWANFEEPVELFNELLVCPCVGEGSSMEGSKRSAA